MKSISIIILCCFINSSAAPQRSQPQVGDRRQIDDMEANNSRSNAGATASLPTVRSTGSVTTQDDLGPLPPGWQMSKNDNERTFFIDHLNKRTTWVGNAEALSFIWLLLFFL